ncbi:hypothetical protein ABBQ32_013805 [Trebouxia sp. C0010 RCD-2024]
MHDPYAVLGLTRTATSQQVKQAYKKLALRWHPDLLPVRERQQAEATFKDISAAYAKIVQGGRIRQAGPRYSTQGGARAVADAKASPSFINALLAFCLCVPLVLTGVQFGKTYPKWQEQSGRPHGIMSPPVNPWLKAEQRATEFSHIERWQQGRTRRLDPVSDQTKT